MVVYATSVQVGEVQVFEVVCQHCGNVIGTLSGQEVLAMSTGEYGPVICFDCQDELCPGCWMVETGGDECTLCALERQLRES